MKKILLFSAMLLCAIGASAQALYVWHGGVATAVNASSAGEMTYSSGGSVLTILGHAFAVSDIDSLTIGDEVSAGEVKVSYAGTTATAVVPIALVDTVSVAVSGAYVTATSLATAGDDITYALSGSSSDGAFTQNGKYKCTLRLDGVSLASQQGAAISVVNGKRIRIILADGTTSTLADAASGTQRACLYVKGHPEFEGSGTLNITGNAKHGIATTEYMQVKSGTINVLSAANDGIHAGQYYKQSAGTVSISGCKGDGIQAEVTNDATDELNGQMIIQGGTVGVSIESQDVKGLRADSLITLSGGKITVNMKGAGVKGIGAGTDLLINQDNATLSVDITVNGDVYTDPTTAETSKTRCIKAKGNVTISAGTVTLKAYGKKAKTVNADGVTTKSSKATVTTNDSYVFDRTVS